MREADSRIMLSDGVCYEHVEDADLHHQVRELLGLLGESLFSFSFGSLWSQGKVSWGWKSHFAFSATDTGFRHCQTVSVSTAFILQHNLGLCTPGLRNSHSCLYSWLLAGGDMFFLLCSLASFGQHRVFISVKTFLGRGMNQYIFFLISVFSF